MKGFDRLKAKHVQRLFVDSNLSASTRLACRKRSRYSGLLRTARPIANTSTTAICAIRALIGARLFSSSSRSTARCRSLRAANGEELGVIEAGSRYERILEDYASGECSSQEFGVNFGLHLTQVEKLFAV